MPNAPQLVYDDRCAFCRRWAARLARRIGARLTLVPSSAVRGLSPDQARQLIKSVVFVPAVGPWTRGAAAVLEALALTPGGDFGLRLYRRHLIFRWTAEAAYAAISRMRPLLSPLCDLMWGPPEGL